MFHLSTAVWIMNKTKYFFSVFIRTHFKPRCFNPNRLSLSCKSPQQCIFPFFSGIFPARRDLNCNYRVKWTKKKEPDWCMIPFTVAVEVGVPDCSQCCLCISSRNNYIEPLVCPFKRDARLTYTLLNSHTIHNESHEQ